MPFRWHCSKYMCFYCGCPFNDSTQLKQHNFEEHSDTKIRSAFRSLLRNSKIKLEVSEIKCKICLAQFPKLDGLVDHFAEHDFKIDHSLKTELFAFRLSEEKMDCEECGEEFQFFGTLLKHFHSFHNKNEPYICEICGVGFVAKANVAAHVKNVHSKDNPCDKCLDKNCEHIKKPSLRKCLKCSEVLPTPYLYKRHLATVHDVKSHQFPCDLCPRVFPIRYRLFKHKQRVHLKQRSFACEICGYRAFSKDYLTRHMVCHDDARPFECDFCKKTFQRKKTLEFHRRIHTNDKRCVCKECGKAFVQTTSLKLHYRVHHPKDGSKDADWT